MKKNQQHVVFSTKKVAKRTQQQAREAAEARTNAVTPKSTATTTTATTTTTHRSATTATATAAATEQTHDAQQSSSSSSTSNTSSGRPLTPRMQRHGSSGNVNASPGSSRQQSSQRRSSPHSQRRSSSGSSSGSSRKSGSTKELLQPATALLQSEQISVAQCVRSMVEKKTDATLLLDSNGHLTGILTDRDIAFKVVAVGKNPRLTRVCDVMTPNPSCVASNASAIDALKKMVSGQFRHLPVTDNEKGWFVRILHSLYCTTRYVTDLYYYFSIALLLVVGILDIAECLYDAISKIEHGYELSPDRLSEAVKKLFLPTLSAILTEGTTVPIVGPTSTALDAAKLMLEKKTSAVMVCNEAGEMVGIFTSKDLMRRVVAVGIDPNLAVLSSVMTTNPYSATLGTTILETLHSMHNGRFLHVPVFDENVKLVGLVDVLQVTCGVVQQMGTFQRAKNDNVQPLWDKFRNSLHHSEDTVEGDEQDDGNDSEAAIAENDNESSSTNAVASNALPPLPRMSPPVIGGQTWDEFVESHSLDIHDPSDPTAPDSPDQEGTPNVFVYKLADCYGTNHRFTSSAESLKDLLHDVQNRLGDHTIRKVHYVDDEGDHVLLFKDDDLKDAVTRAKMWGNKYIRLIVPYRMSRISERGRSATRHAFAHRNDSALGMVYYAAAAAAIAGASFLLSRRK